MKNEQGPIIVFVTAPSIEVARELASMVLNKRLAACVNIVNQIESHYHWEGKLCCEQEQLLIIKTETTKYAELETQVLSTHPYSVPEVVAVPIVKGSESYLNWISKSLK